MASSGDYTKIRISRWIGKSCDARLDPLLDMRKSREGDMTRVVVHSKVGPDGVRHVDVPMGVSQANREVRVIVEENTPAQPTGGLGRFHTPDCGCLARKA
jgi:hypothetical protein